MATKSVPDVIVWELETDFGCWYPYKPIISNGITKFFYEDHARESTSTVKKPGRYVSNVNTGNRAPGGKDEHTIDLEEFSPKKRGYGVNISKMEEIRFDTGSVKNVRIKLYPGDSLQARGIKWQFEERIDHWMCYDAESTEIIEKYSEKGVSMVDLSQEVCGLPYIVDLSRRNQKRLGYGTIRRIRRVELSDSYTDVAELHKRGIEITKNPQNLRSGEILNEAASSKTIKMTSKDAIQRFTSAASDVSNVQDCSICMMPLVEYSEDSNLEVVALRNCDHYFHTDCLSRMYESGSQEGHFQCPICKTIYGEKRGNCPDGRMRWRVVDRPLPGHSACDSILIEYHIRPGIQGPGHPHPGKRYSANFPRTALLPNSEEGQKVLRLLQVAWMRRLTFTIGMSVTTGREDTVTWNEIHHKTQPSGPYGYPDPKYLENVTKELALHGVTEIDIEA